MPINPNIFREYDIRGLVETDLTTPIVRELGKGIGTFLKRQGAQRLREARFNAYRQNRIDADERQRNADVEVSAFYARIQAQVERERERYPQVLPDLVQAMDRQVNVEGSLM